MNEKIFIIVLKGAIEKDINQIKQGLLRTERSIFEYANWPKLRNKELVRPAGPSS